MSSARVSYVNTPVDFEMRYFTIPERLEELANDLGDKEVYVFLTPEGQRESITASELFKKSQETAQLLVKLGVEKGDVVANCIPNTLDSLVCTFGIICAGGLVLNTAISRSSAGDIADTLARTSAKGIILDPGTNNKDLKACLNIIEHVKEDGKASCKTVPTLKFLLSTTGVENFDILDYKNHGIDVSDVRLPRIDPEDHGIIFTTSGSTGEPKFVPQSHHAAMLCGFHLQESMLFEPDDTIYTERRIAWIGGFPYMYLHNGVKTVTKTAPFASLRDHCLFTAKAIENEKCNIAGLLPATIIGITDIWKETGSPKCMLKNIHVGGLPVANVCMDAIGRYTTNVTNIYGSSEAGYIACNTIRNKSDYVSYSVGTPLRGAEIKVVDENGFVVPRGVTGDIYARSPTLFYQYYKDEEKTRQVLSRAHWMDTDDVGMIGEDGKLIVSGRKSDIIIQGGKNFIPSKVEAVIKAHPDVLDVIVVPIPDEAKFVLVCACVIGKSGRSLTAKKLQEYLVTEYQPSAGEAFSQTGPEHILIYDDYPRLYTGKPNKHKLKIDAISRVKGGK